MWMLWNARLRWLGCGLMVAVLLLVGALVLAVPSRWVRVFWVLLPDGDAVECGRLYPGALRPLGPPESCLVWHHGGERKRCGAPAAFRGSLALWATPDLRGISCSGNGLIWLDRSTGEMGVHGQTLQPTPRWALGGGGILLATEEVDPP